MANTRVLRSSKNPAGWALADLLMTLRLELEEEAIAARVAGAPSGVRLQLIGLLLQAEGLERERAPVLEAQRERPFRHLAPVT